MTVYAKIVSGNILMQITDHFPQFMMLKNTHVRYNNCESFEYENSRFKEDKFLDDFIQIDFTYLENDDLDVSNKFDRFLKDLNTLTNQYAPIKRRSRKEIKLKDKPWINNRIQKMMRIRVKILQKMKKQQTPDNNVKLHKKCRNRVSNELKERKARYFHNYFSANNQNMKKLWSGIKTIISKSSSSSSINKSKARMEM